MSYGSKRNRIKTLPFAKPVAKRKTKKKNHRNAGKTPLDSEKKVHGKATKTGLIRRLDKLVGGYARSRGYCQMAGKDKVKCGGALQWCHLITRGNKRLRWDEHNYLVMCAGHHRYYTTHNFEFVEQILTFWPEKAEYIRDHKNEILKLTVPLLELMVGDWEMKIYTTSIDTLKENPKESANHNWFEKRLDAKLDRFKKRLDYDDLC